MKQAIFGSQFFNFDTQSRKISVATDFWIFWVLMAALSLTVSIMYYYLYGLRGSESGSVRKLLALKRLLSL